MLPWFVTADCPQYGQTLFLRGGADFVTMPLDDIRAAPTHTEATSAVTEESNGRAHSRAVLFRTPQPLSAYDRVHVLIDRC